MTPKQTRFVEEYLVDLNATQAAVRAGYSPKTAASVGSENLRKPEIAAAIQERQKVRSESTGVTAARVVDELARIAFSDLGELFDGERLKAVTDLPEGVRRALAGIDVVREKRRTDGDTTVEEDIHKIRLWDKPRALELLARHLGMLKDTIRHEGIPQLVIRVSDDI